MARLYADENFPLAVVEELRRLGHDVVTVHESGKANRATPDVEVLEFARSEGRVVLTLNRKHFIALHASTPGHGGIVVESWCARSMRTSLGRRIGFMLCWFCMPN